MFNVLVIKFSVFAAVCLMAFSAKATVQRTYVSMAHGNDANVASNCTPILPCRTFQGALAGTTDGGEIVVLDSGGYSKVVIDRSVSIVVPDGIYGGITVTSGDGVTIATPSVKVTLKGLTINGLGGARGVVMTDGAGLNLDGVTLSNFQNGALEEGAVVISTAAKVFVKRTNVSSSLNGITVGYGASLRISDSSITDVQEGILIWGGTSGLTTVVATDTSVDCISPSCSWGFDNFASSGSAGQMYLTRISVTGCEYGIINEPAEPTSTNIMNIGSSLIVNNATGFNNTTSSTFFYSAGNNQLGGNQVDTGGVLSVLNLQ